MRTGREKYLPHSWPRQIYPETAFAVFNLFLLSKSLYIIIGRGSRGSDIFSCHTG